RPTPSPPPSSSSAWRRPGPTVPRAPTSAPCCCPTAKQPRSCWGAPPPRWTWLRPKLNPRETLHEPAISAAGPAAPQAGEAPDDPEGVHQPAPGAPPAGHRLALLLRGRVEAPESVVVEQGLFEKLRRPGVAAAALVGRRPRRDLAGRQADRGRSDP